MSISIKYGRTFHYPFSPGTTSDDRINQNFWEDISLIKSIIHTEKLDGENNCISKNGVFARSHAAPTVSLWTNYLREKWHSIKHDLGDYEIFGENLYAIHSIEYPQIKSYYHVFAIRLHDYWLSWEETKFIAQFFDFETVPFISSVDVSTISKQQFITDILNTVQLPSKYESIDTYTKQNCTMEGLVSRNLNEYPVADFQSNVFKYVRKGHVKTDEHWTKNWKKAKLNFE
jgi:hypothetical protein